MFSLVLGRTEKKKRLACSHAHVEKQSRQLALKLQTLQVVLLLILGQGGSKRGGGRRWRRRRGCFSTPSRSAWQQLACANIQ